MIKIKRKPTDSKQDDDKDEHLDGPPPAGQSPQLLLLGGGPDVSGAPEVVGDEGVGGHGHSQRRQELNEEHHQGHPRPTASREQELRSG